MRVEKVEAGWTDCRERICDGAYGQWRTVTQKVGQDLDELRLVRRV